MPPKGLHQVQVATFEYDFAEDGGATGAITLRTNDNELPGGDIPDNAQILRAFIEGIVDLTSGGAATVKLGITGDDDCFVAATALTDAMFDVGKVTALTAGIPIKTSADVAVLATVATAALTAGKFKVHVEYLPGD